MNEVKNGVNKKVADNVRHIWESEGKSARNLISWNVPFQPDVNKSSIASGNIDSQTHVKSSPKRIARSYTDNEYKKSTTPDSGRHVRARYWAFLIENLKLAVDEIYCVCEDDESTVECKEVILMLNSCVKDFESLIDKINVQKEFESLEKAKRPSSISWEVRKCSPMKFLTNNPPEGSSWADRVKGLRRVSDDRLKDAPTSEVANPKDSDDWETVGKTKPKAKTVSSGKVKNDGDASPKPVANSNEQNDAAIIINEANSERITLENNGSSPDSDEKDKIDRLNIELNDCYEQAIQECEEEESHLTHALEQASLTEILPVTISDEDEDESATPSPEPNEPPKSMSWADQIDEEEELKRDPGRALQIHERLSSNSRISTWAEKKQRHERKQDNAEKLRQQMLEETMQKQRMLAQRIQEVRKWKHEIEERRKSDYDRKLSKAEDNRKQHLQEIVRKAHEEENKVNEIAFIKSLESQNKRHEMASKYQNQEARKQEIDDERQRKLEEKAAMEEAARERRRQLDIERQTRLQELQLRREERIERIESLLSQKDQSRISSAREKELVREKKIAAVNEQHQASVECLQKKIQEKLDESNARYLSILAEKKERAAELGSSRHPVLTLSSSLSNGVPNLEPYTLYKQCFLCRVILKSDLHLLSHLKGKKHIQFMKKELGREVTENDVERLSVKFIGEVKDNVDTNNNQQSERMAALKKKCKKLRSKMNQRGKEYELREEKTKPSPCAVDNKVKIHKSLKDLTKMLSSSNNGPWPEAKIAQLDRTLGELQRIFQKNVLNDKCLFRAFSGYQTIGRILLLANNEGELPTKSYQLATSLLIHSCLNSYENARYLIYSNKIGPIIDLLSAQMSNLIQEMPSSGFGAIQTLPYSQLVVSLLQLMSLVLDTCTLQSWKNEEIVKVKSKSGGTRSALPDIFRSRISDAVNYILCVGLIDKIADYFKGVRRPIACDTQGSFLLSCQLKFIISLTNGLCALFCSDEAVAATSHDECQLLTQSLVYTDLAGSLSLLYGILLHTDALHHDANENPAQLPDHVCVLATNAFTLLNSIAKFDLSIAQKSLGDESMSLQFRHIASYLLWHCIKHENVTDLTHQVIMAIGFFACNNYDNQLVVQAGRSPTLLQQMCSLPFDYFSDPLKIEILFPTLISCCYQNQANKEILEQEVTSVLLSTYLKEQIAKYDDESQKLQTFRFARRFPIAHWNSALQFFSS